MLSWQLLNYIQQNIITQNDICLQLFIDDPDERVLFKKLRKRDAQRTLPTRTVSIANL